MGKYKKGSNEPKHWHGLPPSRFIKYRSWINKQKPGICGTYCSAVLIHDAIYQMSVILSSVHYHDKILESLIGSNVINYKEENFEILAPKDSVSSSEGYLDYDYDQTYEGYDGEIKDEDSIEILEDGER